MGLALCHRIPRNPVIYAGLLLLFCSIALQAACVALRHRKDGGGEITSADGGQIAVVASFPSIRGVSGCADSVDCSRVICGSDLSVIGIHCSRFLEGFHSTNTCAVTALVFSVLAFLFCLFFSVSLSSSAMNVLVRLVCALCFPAGFLCAALILFFVKAVPEVKSTIRENSSFSAAAVATLRYQRGSTCNIYIAATCLGCAPLALVFLYGFYEMCCRNDSHRSSLVNDDWARQREVLRSHARAVSAEIHFKAEVDPTFAMNTPEEEY